MTLSERNLVIGHLELLQVILDKLPKEHALPVILTSTRTCIEILKKEPINGWRLPESAQYQSNYERTD